jgi:hypothetical protein
MRRRFLHVGLWMGALSCTAAAAGAQQIVHALTGKVTAVYPASKTIMIDTDDGSQGVFDVISQNVSMSFEKNVKAMTIPAASFTKADCQVVVFFFGLEGVRTVVAVEDLGSAPLANDTGTVVKLDKHAHVLTIKSDAGEEQNYHIDAKTLADTTYGVMEGQKFSPDKGVKVRVTSSGPAGSSTALFIRELSL